MLEEKADTILNLVTTAIGADFTGVHPFVEQFALSYQPGRFHTQGLFSLAQLNSMVRYGLWLRMQKQAVTVMPNSARKELGIKPSIRSRDATKAAVCEYVEELFPSFIWARTRGNNLQKTEHDRADAIVLALYGWIKTIQSIYLKNTALLDDLVHTFARSVVLQQSATITEEEIARIARVYVMDDAEGSGTTIDDSKLERALRLFKRRVHSVTLKTAHDHVVAECRTWQEQSNA